MAWRVYLMPWVVEQKGLDLVAHPAYVLALGCNWGAAHFGGEDACVVAADVNDMQQSELLKRDDVLEVAQEKPSSSVVDSIATWLDARHLSLGEITDGMDWRILVRRLVQLGLLLQRLNARGLGTLRTPRETDATCGALQPTVASGLRAACADRGSKAEVATTATVREVLASVAAGGDKTPLRLGGLEI